jgi:hypothetical protein
MMWNNECRKSRRLLALWAGNDLDERDAAALERHLAVCPQCRDVRQALHRSQQALEVVGPAGGPDGQQAASVWPGVSRHIRTINEPSESVSRWHEWLPTAALAAACVTIIVVLFPPARPNDGHLAAVQVQGGTDVSNVRSLSGNFSKSGRRQFRVAPVQTTVADPESYRNF